MFIYNDLRAHFGEYQPLFINDLPYGEHDDFNENVQWESNFTKHSYELLTLIFEENSTIMTKVYVLNAMKPIHEKHTKCVIKEQQRQQCGSDKETRNDNDVRNIGDVIKTDYDDQGDSLIEEENQSHVQTTSSRPFYFGGYFRRRAQQVVMTTKVLKAMRKAE